VERRRSDRAPRGVDDLPRGERGGADVADLALLNEVGERGEPLVDVGVRVGAVDLVQVDPVGDAARTSMPSRPPGRRCRLDG
jgi:hypothetical protein